MKRPGLKKTGFITFALLLFLGLKVKGQETGPHFLLPGISQTSLFNPAHINETDKLVLGVPFFSGIYGNWNANVPVNSFFFDGFSYSFKKLYNELAPQGKIDASARASVFLPASIITISPSAYRFLKDLFLLQVSTATLSNLFAMVQWPITAQTNI